MLDKSLNMRELIQAYADAKPEKNALIFLPRGEELEKKLSYRELHKQAGILAYQLKSSGMQGARVLLVYPSCLEYIVAFLACLYAGVIAVPVYPPRNNHHATRLKNIVNDADVSAILTLSSIGKTISQQLGLTQVVITDLGENKSQQSVWYNPDISFTDLAYLQYTSGSTGTPKGVMVRHSDLINQCAMYQGVANFKAGETHVSWLPIFHDMGLVQGIMLPLFLAGTCVFMPPAMFVQRPIRWLRTIAKYGANMSGGPNFAYGHCVEKTTKEERQGLDLSTWTCAVNGAEPIVKKTLDDFETTFAPYGFKGKHMCAGYGMAEATLMVTLGKPLTAPTILYLDKNSLEKGQAVLKSADDPETRPTVSCGLIQPGAHPIIVNAATGELCADGEVGEVWLSSTSVCAGYWQREEHTQETFRNRISSQANQDFLRSGDLGFIYEQQLYITGRLKDLIIIRGENHYPQDIEQTAQSAHLALRPGNSGAAFTVSEERAEQLIVVQEVERTQRNRVDVEQVVQCITRNIFQVHGITPREVILTKPGVVPLTSSGKIQRQTCRSRYLSGELEDYRLVKRQPQKNELDATPANT